MSAALYLFLTVVPSEQLLQQTYRTRDGFVLKILSSSCSVKAVASVSLLPATRLVRHFVRAKFDTDLDRVKYITLPGSLTL